MSVFPFTGAEMAEFQAEAERQMTDAGTARRPSSSGYTYNSTTKQDVRSTTKLFDSPCKIQSRNLVVQESEVGGRAAITIRTELHLPASTDPLTAGDLFVISSVGPGSTVAVGTTYEIKGPAGKSWQTSRRYEVEVAVT